MAVRVVGTAALREGAGPPRWRAAFHHDPRALLEQLAAGITELEDLTFMVPPDPCEAELYLDQGEPRIRRMVEGARP